VKGIKSQQMYLSRTAFFIVQNWKKNWRKAQYHNYVSFL
jgi:hypothetical protein